MVDGCRFSVEFPDRFSSLCTCYNEKGRFYHTWEHIKAMFRHFRDVEERFHSPYAVEIAILYHDVIYDPFSKENEIRSAEFLLHDMDAMLDNATIQQAQKLILATAGHRLPDIEPADFLSDCALFLDIDLSILGSSRSIYGEYEENIRKEYEAVPIELFRSGRRKILSEFLERDRLYFSDFFWHKFEIQARANLAEAIKALSD